MSKYKFNKRAMSPGELATRLLQRGLEGDKVAIEERLRLVSYYHLSGYSYYFRKPGSDRFKEGTSFEQIWSLYRFDRRLRLIVLDGMEKIEQALRCATINEFGVFHPGPFDYMVKDNFRGLRSGFHSAIVEDFTVPRDVQTNKPSQKYKQLLSNTFIKQFLAKYQDRRIPFWMAAELITFGRFVQLANKSHSVIKKNIARSLESNGYAPKVVFSWLVCLVDLRNRCAHQQRIWNWYFAKQPMIPKGPNPQFWSKFEFDFGNGFRRSQKIYCLLIVMTTLLETIAPSHDILGQVDDLIKRHPVVDRAAMGYH